MAIVYPIAMPAMPPGPKQITLAQNFQVGEYDSPFTGQGQIYEQQGSWWSAKVDLPFLTRAQAAPWIAFLAALNGRSGTFLFGDPTVLGPLGTAGGAPSVFPGGQTGKTLVIQSLTGTLKAGDYFQIGGENRLLYSQAFDNAAWQYVNVTRPTADTIVAPDASTSAEALTSTAASASATQSLPAGTFMPGQTYSLSIWLKAPGGARNLNIKISDATNGTAETVCALTTSWQRFMVTFTAANSTSPAVQIGTSTNPWPNAIEIDAWGAQVELGTPANLAATDYFSTTSAAQPSIRRLHMNLGDVSGNPCTLSIFPRLRESPIIGWATGYLLFAKPQGLFRLDGNADVYTIDAAGHYAISFGAREAF
ncbi:MAG TPA: carbohydrate binding domain-containing protein [Candidatus Dormibacteraeota bacterium]|nr:carbohydrate binding domain-containing protein [Candidatus Dormibacteraeota bacterium]